VRSPPLRDAGHLRPTAIRLAGRLLRWRERRAVAGLREWRRGAARGLSAVVRDNGLGARRAARRPRATSRLRFRLSA